MKNLLFSGKGLNAYAIMSQLFAGNRTQNRNSPAAVDNGNYMAIWNDWKDYEWLH